MVAWASERSVPSSSSARFQVPMATVTCIAEARGRCKGLQSVSRRAAGHMAGDGSSASPGSAAAGRGAGAAKRGCWRRSSSRRRGAGLSQRGKLPRCLHPPPTVENPLQLSGPLGGLRGLRMEQAERLVLQGPAGVPAAAKQPHQQRVGPVAAELALGQAEEESPDIIDFEAVGGNDVRDAGLRHPDAHVAVGEPLLDQRGSSPASSSPPRRPSFGS